MLQGVLISEDGRRLDELLPPKHTPPVSDYRDRSLFAASAPQLIGEMDLYFDLTDDDRREIENLFDRGERHDLFKQKKERGRPKHLWVPILPKLSYPMSEEEADAFIGAYVKLSDRPNWMPILMSKEREIALKATQAQVYGRHQMALQREFEEGRLVPVDARNVPVSALDADTFITRSDAIAYLKRSGLEYDDAVVAPLPAQSGTLSKGEVTSGYRLPKQPAVGGTPNSMGWSYFTPAQRADAVRRSNKLKEEGERAFVKLVADELGVTTRSLSEWRRREQAPGEPEKKPRRDSAFDMQHAGKKPL